MSGELAVAIVACALTIVTVVAGAVWAVSEIKGTTTALRATIDHLASVIADVKSWLGAVATTQAKHGERLVRIETRLDVSDEEE
jgi:hypothetical protein